MRKSVPERYHTPFSKNENATRLSYTQRPHSAKRKPIFGLRMSNEPINQKTTYFPAYQQNSADHIITYDFCGCENTLVPCPIIEETFLRDVSLNDMKREYMQISDKAQASVSNSMKKLLFSTLPSSYPELYSTHLKNMLKVVGDCNPYEFQCIAWIQYHAKVEYITYFLYEDMKKAYSNQNRRKFMQHVSYELQNKNLSYSELKSYFTSKGHGESFSTFVQGFYDSIAANLVPLTYYAKFIRLIYKRGHKILVNLLANFIGKKSVLEEGLRYLSHHEIERYREYMRELSWDGYFEELL